MKDLLIARLREPSTYAGLAAFIGGLSFIPHVTDIASSLPVLGAAIAGLLAIWLPERK